MSVSVSRLSSSQAALSLGTTARIVGAQDAKNNPRPRRFVPLNPERKSDQKLQPLKGIIFDVDGTLCLPQNYMFREMRTALGIPKSVDILEHIRSLSSDIDQPDEVPVEEPQKPTEQSTDEPSEDAPGYTVAFPELPQNSPQARAVAKIRAIERDAMTSQVPQPGLQELMAYLTKRGIPKALCTRNFPTPIHHLLRNFLAHEVFDPIITRETEGISPKPSPEGLWKIAQAWGLDKNIEKEMEVQKRRNSEEVDPIGLVRTFLGAGLIMVGDSLDDMAAGHRAGAATVLLLNEDNQDLAKHEYTDMSIHRLDELVKILDEGFVGKE